ncbi:MAG: hypothetical protein F4039_07830 [Gammaproteobacteria bacterium]|nr:hypothetical protein [Gammaproteobacteria bacterium]MYF52843.1 hypothetical protein [Gammaproteobacteria bacterium]MYK43979.1 hypothetical protein [Gammaproteobacteria bacterium]
MKRTSSSASFAVGLILGVITVCLVSVIFFLIRQQDGSDFVVQSDRTNNGIDLSRASDDLSSLESVAALERHFKALSPRQRTLSLAGFVSGLNKRELQGLLGTAEEFDIQEIRDELQDVVIRALAISSPRQALNDVSSLPPRRQYSLVVAVFQEWSLVDLDRAVTGAKRFDEPLKRAALKGILTARKDLDDSYLLNIASELENEQFFHDLATRDLVESGIDDPADTWNQLISEIEGNFNSLSVAYQETLVSVAKAWVLQDGLGAITAINSAFPAREDRVWLTQQLLSTLVSEDEEVASGIVENMRHEDREGLLQVVQTWAQDDGWEAFRAAQWMDQGTDHRRMQRAAIEGWASSNPLSLFRNAIELPEPLFEFSRTTALLEMRYTSPESVPALVEEIEDPYTRTLMLDNLIVDWAQRDLSGALRWALEHDQVPGRKNQYTPRILPIAAQKSPIQALTIALEVPLKDDDAVGPEARVLAMWATNDVEAAIDSIPRMRNQNTRMAAFRSIGMELMDQQDYDRVLALVETEPIEDQLNYFEDFAPRLASKNPRFLIEKFDSLPNESFKRLCSEVLLEFNSGADTPFLTDDEVRKFEQFSR